MEHTIDLLILPPYTSHKLQPLDVSVFAPLKRALAAETDAVSRLDPGRIQRVEWTEMYIRAREKGLTSLNIVSGWKSRRHCARAGTSEPWRNATKPSVQYSHHQRTIRATPFRRIIYPECAVCKVPNITSHLLS